MGDVTGTVTYKGTDLKFGYVTVLASDGIVRQAKIQENGSFEFPGLPVGDAKFAVSAIDPKQQEEAMKHFANLKFGGEPQPTSISKAAKPPADTLAKASAIPLEYSDVTNSRLQFHVEPGHNTYDIPLR